MKSIRIVSPVALALGVLLTTGAATGYVLLGPNRTWNCPPVYTVDETGIASITDSDGGVTKVITSINAFASTSDAWNDAGSARVVGARKGSTASFALGDGVPMIKFGDPLNSCTGNCLAVTYIGYYNSRGAGSSSWQITDADIATNLNHAWTSEGEDPSGAGCSGEYYIEGVMMHEIGHGLGIDHSAASGATMLPTVTACSNAPATLAVDDETALQTLYGTAPCTDSQLYPCRAYTSYLTGSGDTDVQPSCDGSFFMSNSGNIKGWSQGPGLSDFDLYLDKWNGLTWVQVASATTLSASDSISYNATVGTYRFRVYAFNGGGTYHFWYKPTILIAP
ncbi:MAG TPA: matrixin family metalloprotease [Thermoanaerobaculia bacterium]|nr:matrixin family metalloprotease [Thermoanaerobaculia bacterium]